MADPTVAWNTFVITVPQSFLTPISGTSYQLSTNAFRNALKNIEDSEDGMPFSKTHSHNGEVLLGGIVYARTLEILAPYTITFEETGTPYSVALVGSNNNILDRTNLGTVQILSNNSAGLVNQRALEQATETIKYQIEATRPSHQGFGTAFFVSPSGDDNASGLLPTTPKLTIAGALADCVSGRGDVIYLLTPAPGQVTFAEAVVIAKEDVHIRGVGRGVILQAPSATSLTINADNCSVSSLFIKSAIASSFDCMVVNGKFAKLDSLFVVGADTGGVTAVGTGNGIHFKGGEYHRVTNCVVEKCGANGILFTDAPIAAEGSPREVVIDNCQIYWNRDSGVKLTGTSANSTRLNDIKDSLIHHNGLYGVYCGANTQRTFIRATNYIKDNRTYPTGSGGDAYEVFADVGAVDVMVEPRAPTATQNADAVWAKTLP